MALLLVFCCPALGVSAAHADEASSSAASAPAQPEDNAASDSGDSGNDAPEEQPAESNNSEAAPAPAEESSDSGSGDAGDSNDEAETPAPAPSPSAAESGSNSAASPSGPSSSDEPSSPAQPSSSSSSSSTSGAVTAGTTQPSASSSSASPNSADAESGEDKEEEPKSPEEEASDKLAQASSLSVHIEKATANRAKFQAEYDEAKNNHDDAVTQRDASQQQLEQESAGLEALQADLSEYVVGLYKQGGAAPYLDVMLRSTSYREFLNSWYMANEVPRYAIQVMHEKNAAVEGLRTQIASLEEQIANFEKDMQRAEINVRQAEATRLALVAQAAAWRLEAARLTGDEDAADEAEEEHEEASDALHEIIEQGIGGDGVLSGTGYFTHPCPDATYSSGFGYRSFDNAFHKGLDMAAPEGTPYYAADNGVVTAATNGGGYNGGAGNWVVIDHGNGIVTKYMHSLVTLVEPGDTVIRGQNIGLVGNTGNSFGAHLHFQVEVGGTAVNPLEYL